MVFTKKLLYMAIGGLLTISLAFGAYSTFAQTDDGTDDSVPSDDAAETEDVPSFPGGSQFGNRGNRQGFNNQNLDLTDGEELLAEALGITVEELQVAKEAVRIAAVEQAVADGLITQEQADQILSGEGRRGGHRGMSGFAGTKDEHDALLAAELGITGDELTAAREEVNDARVQELIDAGVLTQEQADMAQARRDVQSYLDTDALNEMIQAAYQEAIDQALADGVITQEQADELASNVPTFNLGSGGRGGHGGGPRGGGPRGGGPRGGGQGQGSFFGNGNAPLQNQDA